MESTHESVPDVAEGEVDEVAAEEEEADAAGAVAITSSFAVEEVALEAISSSTCDAVLGTADTIGGGEDIMSSRDDAQM